MEIPDPYFTVFATRRQPPCSSTLSYKILDMNLSRLFSLLTFLDIWRCRCCCVQLSHRMLVKVGDGFCAVTARLLNACMVRCRLVTPPADAAVHTMLMGPWRSEGFAGPESVVVPAAALAPGRYTVQLTATQPSTTFTLQVCCRVHSCAQRLARPS